MKISETKILESPYPIYFTKAIFIIGVILILPDIHY